MLGFANCKISIIQNIVDGYNKLMKVDANNRGMVVVTQVSGYI